MNVKSNEAPASVYGNDMNMMEVKERQGIKWPI